MLFFTQLNIIHWHKRPVDLIKNSPFFLSYNDRLVSIQVRFRFLAFNFNLLYINTIRLVRLYSTLSSLNSFNSTTRNSEYSHFLIPCNIIFSECIIIFWLTCFRAFWLQLNTYLLVLKYVPKVAKNRDLVRPFWQAVYILEWICLFYWLNEIQLSGILSL